MKGQLSRKADRRQANVETPMGLIGVTLARLEHDSLRVNQAIRRTGLHDLLGPVLEDHQRIANDLRQVQRYLREIWEEGQAVRWQEQDLPKKDKNKKRAS